LDEGSREDDTPAEIKRFLHQIGPESEPKPETYSDHLLQRHAHKSHLIERIRMADSTTTSTSGRSSSRRGSVAADAGIAKIEEEGDEAAVERKEPAPQQHKFTQMEIVTLWNRFKFDFQSGNINEKQLLQLFRQVRVDTVCSAVEQTLYVN
jgi:hypothetical protein